MKKITLHPGMILLNLACTTCLISLIFYLAKNSDPQLNSAYQLFDNQIFYLQKPMYEADISSFEILKGGYSADKDRIFYDGREVIGVDSESFVVLGYGIGKDKTGVWVFNRAMGYNGETINSLGNLYYQVDDKVYYFEDEVAGADPSSFKPLPRDYLGEDKNGTFYRGRKIKSEIK